MPTSYDIADIEVAVQDFGGDTLRNSIFSIYKQHEQSLQLESRIVGGAVHVAWLVHGTVVVAGASPVSVICFTSTGIAAPVASLKTRWPRTVVSSVSVSGYRLLLHVAAPNSQGMIHTS